MIAEPLRPLARPITEFRPLPGNPRRGDVKAVARSLKRFGQRKPIVVQADGTVTAGNHTLLAALDLGWTELAAVGFEDDDATAKAYALADNRTSALGSFDMADLTAMAVEVHAADPELLLAASYDLAELLGHEPEGRTDPDDVPELPAEPVTRPGDVWVLGPHRLLCGDSTEAQALARLMGADSAAMIWTDPPYNADIAGGTHDPRDKKNYGNGPRIRNDAMPSEQFRSFLRSAFTASAGHLTAGGAVYVCHSDAEAANFLGAFAEAGLRQHQILIWVKQQFVFGRKDYHTQHEPILYGWKPGAAHQFYGKHDQSTTWHVDRPMRSEMEGPSQKPVALVMIALANSSRGGGIVLDPFGGTGSTLIAAHRINRSARLMELDPVYCDVICRRYQEHTGTKPVLEGGGPHDFT